ncbi:PH domain-containing protein [Rhodobacter sp. Har01]|uniref:photosynthetic complex putative assembly protein PuhB n=1 Tax=Rhodobacter sp. Har01 TaxID=2883999 RepID=UPI001D080FE0|nr:photosynthetic complex putative assembly protein PuhB [Rhodobacter sp. Har01]MCB6176800.1 PH domain-containing protein [Rhodobacter sp. Har01]
MSDHDDFAVEPIRGLPERPPVGEEILWQGHPATYALLRDAYKLHWIAFYFVIVVLWRGTVAWGDGGAMKALAIGIPYAVLGVCSLGLLWLVAFAQARTAVYTLTTARVVMRIGAALPVTFNFPFAQVTAAHLAQRRDGTGTIALELTSQRRMGYLTLWPHVRPGYLRSPQPAMRCIPEAAAVARMLAEAAETRMARPVISRREDVSAASATAEVAAG